MNPRFLQIILREIKETPNTYISCISTFFLFDKIVNEILFILVERCLRKKRKRKKKCTYVRIVEQQIHRSINAAND